MVGGGQMWAELVKQGQRLVRGDRNRSWKDDGWSGVIRGGRSQYGKSQDRSVPFRVSRVKSKKGWSWSGWSNLVLKGLGLLGG